MPGCIPEQNSLDKQEACMKITRRQLKNILSTVIKEYRVKPGLTDLDAEEVVHDLIGMGDEDYAEQADELARSLGYEGDRYDLAMDEYERVTSINDLMSHPYLNEEQKNRLASIAGKKLKVEFGGMGMYCVGLDGDKMQIVISPGHFTSMLKQIASKHVEAANPYRTLDFNPTAEEKRNAYAEVWKMIIDLSRYTAVSSKFLEQPHYLWQYWLAGSQDAPFKDPWASLEKSGKLIVRAEE